MMQSFKYGELWTRRLGPTETFAEWAARVPQNDGEPDGCDHYTPWISGGIEVAVCTVCNDVGATACKDAHDATVAGMLGEFPKDP